MATALPLAHAPHFSSSQPAPAPLNTTTATDNPDDDPATRPIHQIPRGAITASLPFYGAPADGSAPYNYVSTPPPGMPQRNYSAHSVAVQIDDARGQEGRFSTDGTGFALLSVPDGVLVEDVNWDEPASVQRDYYPEVEALLRTELQAKRVVVFDHTVRRARKGADRGPVVRVHVDQTERAGRERVRRHVGAEEAEGLLRGRCRIVNVWRPLNGPVVAQPLAVAESDSVPGEAVVPVEHRYPDRVGETAGVGWSEGQKWWYWSGMTGEERILLQCWDSEGGRRTPHTAFEDPRSTGPEWRGRESVEVRALVFG